MCSRKNNVTTHKESTVGIYLHRPHRINSLTSRPGETRAQTYLRTNTYVHTPSEYARSQDSDFRFFERDRLDAIACLRLLNCPTRHTELTPCIAIVLCCCCPFIQKRTEPRNQWRKKRNSGAGLRINRGLIRLFFGEPLGSWEKKFFSRKVCVRYNFTLWYSRAFDKTTTAGCHYTYKDSINFFFYSPSHQKDYPASSLA